MDCRNLEAMLFQILLWMIEILLRAPAKHAKPVRQRIRNAVCGGFFGCPCHPGATAANINPLPPRFGPIRRILASKQSSHPAKTVSREVPKLPQVSLCTSCKLPLTPGFRVCLESRLLPHMDACHAPSSILGLAQASTIGPRICRTLTIHDV